MIQHQLTFQSDILEITIAQDEMEARARIKNFSLPISEIANHLKESIKTLGIKQGFLPENIKKLIQDRDSEQQLVIARGKDPAPAKDGMVKFLVDVTMRPPLEITEEKSIDFSRLPHKNIVFKDTPIVEIIPPSPGQDGYTITGKKLEAASGKEPILKFGPNVKPHPDNPNLIIAGCDGLVLHSDPETIDVLPCQIIRGDVGSDTGHISYPGSVIVMGDIPSGFSIEVGGDLEVYGTVESNHLTVQGNLIVHKGLVGKGSRPIHVGKNAIIGFALYKNIIVQDSLYFQSELVGCHISAGRKVISTEGRIVGGRVEALEKILVRTAGSDEEVQTELVVGRLETLLQKKEELNQLIQLYNQELDKIKKKIYELVVKKIDNQISEEELEILERFQEDKEIIPQKIQEIERNLTRLNHEIEQIEKANIEIRGPIYPKVKLSIGAHTLEIEELRRFSKFLLLYDRISSVPV